MRELTQIHPQATLIIPDQTYPKQPEEHSRQVSVSGDRLERIERLLTEIKNKGCDHLHPTQETAGPSTQETAGPSVVVVEKTKKRPRVDIIQDWTKVSEGRVNKEDVFPGFATIKQKNKDSTGGVRLTKAAITPTVEADIRLRKAFSEYIERGDCRSRKLHVDKKDPRVLINMLEMHLRWPVNSIFDDPDIRNELLRRFNLWKHLLFRKRRVAEVVSKKLTKRQKTAENS